MLPSSGFSVTHSLQKFQTIYFEIYKEITFLAKITESESYQNGRLEKNFKCVVIIKMPRGTIYAHFSILASTVYEKLMGN